MPNLLTNFYGSSHHFTNPRQLAEEARPERLYFIAQGDVTFPKYGSSSISPVRALKRRSPCQDWQVAQTLLDGLVVVISRGSLEAPSCLIVYSESESDHFRSSLSAASITASQHVLRSSGLIEAGTLAMNNTMLSSPAFCATPQKPTL